MVFLFFLAIHPNEKERYFALATLLIWRLKLRKRVLFCQGSANNIQLSIGTPLFTGVLKPYLPQKTFLIFTCQSLASFELGLRLSFTSLLIFNFFPVLASLTLSLLDTCTKVRIFFYIIIENDFSNTYHVLYRTFLILYLRHLKMTLLFTFTEKYTEASIE